jgi:tripartite-type tricarboxylate transporter receptor subunit TctC
MSNTLETLSMTVRALGAVVLAACISLAMPLSAVGQTYPSKPIRIVVPFTPGGSNDVLARAIGEKLAVSLGQPVVVDNKPGASGNIGSDAVAKSPADGYTLLIAANNVMSMNPALFAKMPFDSVKDFEPITLLGVVPVVLAINPDVMATSVKELVAVAKAMPGGLKYASSGKGSPQHLSAELFKSMTGTDIVHIPYKGAAPAVTDLLGGHVEMQFGAINSLLPHVKAGKLRALGVAGSQRVSALPDVPTIAEAGVAGYESDIWIALVAPAKTPVAIVNLLNAEVRKALAAPDVQQKLAEQAIEPRASSPAALAKLVSDDLKRWARVVKDAGIQPE